MTEIVEGGHHFSVERQDLKYSERLYSLVEEAVENQLASDPGEAAFLVAFREALHTPGGSMRPHLEQMVAMNRQMGHFIPHGQMLRRVEFASDKQMRRKLDPKSYDKYMQRPSFWRDALRQLDQDELLMDSTIRLQSNMADAGAVNNLITNRLQHRWGREIAALNNGISLGIPDKKWMLEGFAPIKIVKAPDAHKPIVPGEMEIDEEVQGAVNELTTQKPIVSKVVGYDAVPINPDDDNSIARLFSDTFPFTEAANRPEEVEEFLRLARIRTDKVVAPREVVDARDAESLERLHEYLPGGRADAQIYSAFLFEQKLEEILIISENMKAFANPDAIGIVFDLFDEDFNFIRGDWWHRPGAWAAAIFNPHDISQRIRIGTFTSRRATEMIPTEEGRRFLLTGELPF